MGFLDKIIAYVQTYLDEAKYKKAKEATLILSANLDKLYPTPQIGPYGPHYLYKTHIEQCVKNFIDYAKTSMKNDKDKTWGIGDSILAQAKDNIHDVIDPRLNMGLGGAWAHHMLQLINDRVPVFNMYKFVPNNIVIGTPDGNGLLQHQEVNSCVEQSVIVFNRLRQLYPSARIIIYGLPPTIVPYVVLCCGIYDLGLFNWMNADSNSVMLPLVKNFVEKNHILPKPDWSSDGVHLTPKGQIYFGELIQRGKSGKPKRFVN